MYRRSLQASTSSVTRRRCWSWCARPSSFSCRTCWTLRLPRFVRLLFCAVRVPCSHVNLLPALALTLALAFLPFACCLLPLPLPLPSPLHTLAAGNAHQGPRAAGRRRRDRHSRGSHRRGHCPCPRREPEPRGVVTARVSDSTRSAVTAHAAESSAHTARASVHIRHARVCTYGTRECAQTARASVRRRHARVCTYGTRECALCALPRALGLGGRRPVVSFLKRKC